MDSTFHPMRELFAQLGLPDDDAAIDEFIREHRPLDMSLRLCDAPFWSASQAALIKEKMRDDSDWAVLIDTLSAQLREHPDAAGPRQ